MVLVTFAETKVTRRVGATPRYKKKEILRVAQDDKENQDWIPDKRTQKLPPNFVKTELSNGLHSSCCERG